MKIGVLAIQGDFDAHRITLEKLGAEVILVRNPGQLEGLDGLIIPGGESTAFLELLKPHDFFNKLRDFVRIKPTFGTCAGTILLAKDVENPSQKTLGALDIRVQRNAYGRQQESFIRTCDTAFGPLEMVFIRAPRIAGVGEGVEVLAKNGDDPILVRQRNIMASTFHPELSDSTTIHHEFLKMAAAASEAHVPAV